MRTGLIMEGGAMRGMFTCGVIDVLMENDIRFDGAAGISAGAMSVRHKRYNRQMKEIEKAYSLHIYCLLGFWE